MQLIKYMKTSLTHTESTTTKIDEMMTLNDSSTKMTLEKNTGSTTVKTVMIICTIQVFILTTYNYVFVLLIMTLWCAALGHRYSFERTRYSREKTMIRRNPLSLDPPWTNERYCIILVLTPRSLFTRNQISIHFSIKTTTCIQCISLI